MAEHYQPSLLDDLGEEVTGIVAPVSLCMAVTVLLVRLLNPEGISSANTVLIASIAYQEQAGDSSGKKFGGALLNAIIFVGVVAGMTVVLFLLFKYKEMIDLPDSIKLGLGDFIFYSMLVGRAAMYDFMTVFSAYLAIIAGLGLTLLCLALFQKALPALPFSIVLGVAFYFLTRLTLEPFLIPLSTHLVFY
ncbi:hypothetical protein TSOC_006277 [Tetrabaena socialis]|uniref:Uncharacterized protein n=1 Tax=Tetrabaena socialis TaxID=47790 RepID=A0A2J8A419_9CHLO|nr:hypothetical protein TSOC_006277 [Tetrabaena socialis]|eukprot:PNH07270.1 hypothetical protein TSOC_006277 [Tetrabaena socialis]